MCSVTAIQASAPPALGDSSRVFLKALASETRQRLLLLFADGEPHSVGEVAARAEIGQSTASEQLAILRRAGLLSASRQGKTVLYRADRDGIAAQLDELRAFLAICC